MIYCNVKRKTGSKSEPVFLLSVPAAPDCVHPVSDIADMSDRFVIGSVADIGHAYLEVFPVETSRSRLVGELVPVCADYICVFQGRLYIPFISLSSLFLRVCVDQSLVERPPVLCPEMELSDYHGLVNAFRQGECAEIVLVDVVAENVTVFGRDSQDIRV